MHRVAEKSEEGRVRRMYRLCYGREPGRDEVLLARAYLAEAGPAGWERYAQALLVANEFAFVD